MQKVEVLREQWDGMSACTCYMELGQNAPTYERQTDNNLNLGIPERTRSLVNARHCQSTHRMKQCSPKVRGATEVGSAEKTVRGQDSMHILQQSSADIRRLPPATKTTTQSEREITQRARAQERDESAVFLTGSANPEESSTAAPAHQCRPKKETLTSKQL